MSLSHHTLVAWQRADDLFIRLHQLSLKAFPAFEGAATELETEIRRVGAPLTGLIRSTRSTIRSQVVGIVLLVAYLTVRLA
jgi:hypothetical protein